MQHVAIELGDIAKAVTFYQDVFALEKLNGGEGDAFFKLGAHQFLAMFERKDMTPDQSDRHFGLMVRDEEQIAEIRNKLTTKYGIELIPGFPCDFRDLWGNRIQVVDLHDESLVWLLPYQEVHKAGIDLAVRWQGVIEKLLGAEAPHSLEKNLVQSREFSEMLKATLNKYHNRAISTRKSSTS